MKQAKTQAYIRQLCCLGLGDDVLILELLRALHDLIPSENNAFAKIDAKMAPTHVFLEYFVPEAMDAFINEQERVFSPVVAGMVKWYSHCRVAPDLAVLLDRPYQSDFYHLILRPCNQHHVMQAVLRHNGIPIGSINLFRTQNQRPFSANDRQQLERLLPYVEHGMQARGEVNGDYVDSGQAGMIILTRAGTVVHFSELARTLLLQATHGALVVVGRGLFTYEAALSFALRQICGNLGQIFQGQDTPPPVFSHTNSSGRFVFRAYGLQPPTATLDLGDATRQYASGDGLIGITIERQEPLRLKFLRGLQGWRLSVREQDVCLALADHLSQPVIAAQLGVSAQTVVTYVRRIYEKLEVHNREELLKKLLSLQP